jgi:hypothetical protein
MAKVNPAHAIDSNTRNSDIEYCISEYVRKREHREILREKWFEGLTFEELAAKHHLSVTVIKDIVYGIGDPILIKASKERRTDAHVLLRQILKLLKTS